MSDPLNEPFRFRTNAFKYHKMKRLILALSLIAAISMLSVSCTTAKSSARGGCISTKGMAGYR